MTFKEVNDIPINPNPSRRDKKDIKTLILNFIASDIKYAELIFTEEDYSSPLNARNSFAQCIRENDYPVWVYLRNGRVFLERKD